MTGDHSSRSHPALFYFEHYIRYSIHHFQKLSIRGKLLISAIALFNCFLAALIIIITPARIAQIVYDLGQVITEHHWGWLLLVALIQIASFPPMIGHTTMLNLCGFTYGINGFLVAALASLVASAVVFVVSRYIFGERLRSWSEKNEAWKAVEAVVDAKGLPLIILIRISPFPPWSYSNALFASIQAVSLWQFVVATTCNFPKYLLYVFIGSRMASLSDGKQREHMDTETKVVNSILIVAGLLSSVASGWILYALVKRHLQGVALSPLIPGPASDVPNEDVSLLGNFSSESLHESV